jgi:hypothetical protein
MSSVGAAIRASSAASSKQTGPPAGSARRGLAASGSWQPAARRTLRAGGRERRPLQLPRELHRHRVLQGSHRRLQLQLLLAVANDPGEPLRTSRATRSGWASATRRPRRGSGRAAGAGLGCRRTRSRCRRAGRRSPPRPGRPARRSGPTDRGQACGGKPKLRNLLLHGPGQPEPVGQLTQQRRPGMADHPSPSAVTSKQERGLVACTRKVPSSSGECDLEQPHSPSSGGHLRYHGSVTQGAREILSRARLGPLSPIS